VLRLKENGKYEHMYCTKSDLKIDTGNFSLSRMKLSFLPLNRKVGSHSLKEVSFYMKNETLYEKRLDAILKKNSYSHVTTDTIYRQSFEFNPLTKKYIEVKVAFTEAGTKVDNQDKVYFMGLLRNFAPHYKALIDSNYCGPGCYYTLVNNEHKMPSKDTTNDRMIHSFNTMVHETVHHFNSGSVVLVQPDIVIHYPDLQTFRSQEFVSLVPEEAKTKIFRYSTYVSQGSKVSANLSGICGIMDEFSAYRNGTKASLDAALAAKALKNDSRTKDFLGEALPTYYACYEFRVFIAWYLEYSAKSKPELHKALMANTNFRVAFTLLEQGFLEDIKVMEKLVKENPSYQWLYDVYEKDSAFYCKELLKKQEKILSAFRIPGVTKVNYRSFLAE